MLVMSKGALTAARAETYYEEKYSHDDYYSEKQSVVGQWFGRGAEELGLSGEVATQDFRAVLRGLRPASGEVLVHKGNGYDDRRAGWDATFSAPKSVSLTALVGGDDRVREAHRDSVRVALDQLEYYTQARIGGNHPPETTGRFIAAKFEHDTARPVDGYVAPRSGERHWLTGREAREYVRELRATHDAVLVGRHQARTVILDLVGIGSRDDRREPEVEQRRAEHDALEAIGRHDAAVIRGAVAKAGGYGRGRRGDALRDRPAAGDGDHQGSE